MGDLVLTFSLPELLLLENHLSPSEISLTAEQLRAGVPQNVPAKELCLKVGSGLLQALPLAQQGKEIEIEVALSDVECWLLRERIGIFEGVANQSNAGMNIKRKLYAALLEYDAKRQMGELPTSQHEEPKAKEVRDALAQRPRDRDAGTDGADDYPHNPTRS